MCSTTWERATKALSSSPLCRELLFVAYEYCGATALLYKQGMSCDLRRGRFDTRLFKSNPCNGTSQGFSSLLVSSAVVLNSHDCCLQGAHCVPSKKSTINCSRMKSGVFPFTLSSSWEEPVLIAHSLPKLQSSAQIDTHD